MEAEDREIEETSNVEELKLRPHHTRVRDALESGDGEQCYNVLTEKQKAWCREYLKDLNASKAALRAGYKTENPNRVGSELKRKPHVDLALQWLMRQRAEENHIDANFVINKIVKSLDRSEKKENEAAVLRAAELLGKHLGVFIERTEVSGPDGEAIETKRKIEEDAAAFTRTISRLSKSEQKDEDDGGDDTGS